jgi:isopentenyl-diphosphate delta-isomerase
MSVTNQRKHDHLQTFRRDPAVERNQHYFDAIALAHRALPEIALAEVDPAVEFLGKRLSFPLLISAMTGGSAPIFQKINRHLALAAEAEGVALAVGSQRVMFAAPAACKSFAVRRYAPTVPLLANLGAVQLNYGFGLNQCRAVVCAIGADALILHLNPLQEAIQREGNTDFRGLAAKVGAMARKLGKPVIVKEVGAGLALADAQLLVRHGIKILDVAGAGGTSWSRVEHHRRAATDAADDLGLVFQDWGWPTPLALQALQPLRKKITLIASGGIRTGLDMAKAMVLGASLCGVAAPLLQPAQESADAVRAVLQRLRREFVTAMFLLGCRNVAALCGNARLLRPA